MSGLIFYIRRSKQPVMKKRYFSWSYYLHLPDVGFRNMKGNETSDQLLAVGN
jgi:hypothetical protein